MEYNIIKANKANLDDIVELWLKLMAIHEKLDPFFFSEINKEEYCDDLEGHIDNPEQIIFIAILNDVLIGYITADIISRVSFFNKHTYCVIGDIMISENHRNTGLGKLLIDEVKNWSKNNNVLRMELNVFAKNILAVNFFKNIGFQNNFHTLFIEL